MLKLSIIMTCSCLLTIPALAKEQPATGARQGSAMPQNFNYSKEAYMEQVSKSLDAMDKNKDGKIDASEMSAASEDSIGDDEGFYDEDPFENTANPTINNVTPKEVRTMPAPAQGSPAPSPAAGGVTGVPPINADQLINK